MSAAYERHFLSRVQTLSGIADADAAKRLAAAVIMILAEQLRSQDRALLAHFLPPGMDHVPHGPPDVAPTFEAFCERVGARAALRAPFDLEHTQTVCRVLGEALGAEQCVYFLTRLPDYLAPLLAEAGREPAPPAAHAVPGREHTLAAGRPGSSHPLSEAEATRVAQAESVVRTDNPHGDTKLSTAHGTTQEREAESLAEGEPGSKRSLSSVRR